ncbi:MAG: hypothetical protein R3C14_05100 [Caldilineaceae bacterium]
MNNNQTSKVLVWSAIAFIIITGLVHLIDAGDAMGEAAYKGLLFYANGLAALVAAYGIYRGERSWGWHFGALIAAATIVGYVASRTVGLPQIPAEPDEWLEPLGVVSLLAEGLFLVVYGWALSHTSAQPTQALSMDAGD